VQLLHFISVTCFPFFSETLVLFFVGHEWLVFAMLPPTFFLSVYMCVCLDAFCGARFCVQVRSFNFDLCFRLFCVAFVDFCHLNRNFYFVHVPVAVAPSFGFGFRFFWAWGLDGRLQPSPVGQFFVPTLFWPDFFLSLFFINACPWGIGNASERRANWISFFGHLKLTSADRGPRMCGISRDLTQNICSSRAVAAPKKETTPPPNHPEPPFLLATRIHKSGNLIYATVAFICPLLYIFFFSIFRIFSPCFAFVNLKLPANAINSQCSLNI